eukprot:366450-Chlamydomonas_euryale.AAC.38
MKGADAKLLGERCRVELCGPGVCEVDMWGLRGVGPEWFLLGDVRGWGLQGVGLGSARWMGGVCEVWGRRCPFSARWGAGALRCGCGVVPSQPGVEVELARCGSAAVPTRPVPGSAAARPPAHLHAQLSSSNPSPTLESDPAPTAQSNPAPAPQSNPSPTLESTPAAHARTCARSQGTRQQAQARGVHGWQLHGVQPRHDGRRPLLRDRQPTAGAWAGMCWGLRWRGGLGSWHDGSCRLLLNHQPAAGALVGLYEGWNAHAAATRGWDAHAAATRGWDAHAAATRGWNAHAAATRGWRPCLAPGKAYSLSPLPGCAYSTEPRTINHQIIQTYSLQKVMLAMSITSLPR